MTEREQIEELHRKYVSLRENTPEMKRNGAECKAYHVWYESAYVYFKSFASLKNDPDFQIFVSAEKEGNCFVLAHIYDSISPSYKVLMKNTENIQKTDTNLTPVEKTPMLFISHSSKDKDFVEALVVLLEDLGFDSTNLFCSSVDGYGIGLSEDIFETLRSLFNKHNLYVIFIHSPRYYKSPISLNEMGAAWVLKTDFCSFLTKDMDFGMMTGVVNGSTISIKVDADDTPSRLTELKDKLIPMFGLNQMDGTKWERKRQSFLKKLLTLNYEPVPEENEENLVFSPNELQIFSKWANNEYDTNYIVVRNRSGLEVHFGYHNGYSFPYGEGEAELEDFLQRLQNAGFVKIGWYDSKNRQPIYKITKHGFDYAKTLLGKQL